MATARCGLCLSGCRVRRCALGRPLLAAGFAFPAAAFGAALGGWPLLAAGFAFPAAAFGAALGGREQRAARLGPFSCGLGAVCAFVRFPIAVFQYAASGLLVLDRYFWFFDAGFRFSTTDFELSATDFNFRLQSYQALSTCSIPKCGYFSPLIRIGMHKSGYCLHFSRWFLTF